MSQISGVRKLRHTNSFSGVTIPKYGIDVPNEEELSKVRTLKLSAPQHTPNIPKHPAPNIPPSNTNKKEI